ncbi:MAG: alpha-hydroxy-acid oxidizing protein [Betaproteobacteria bacterium]|jgi:(S)-mandelate dehydrogenase|nr:alpha-hydroxy-acid oxidizing protein [Betaproteobacteria bacterium]
MSIDWSRVVSIEDLRRLARRHVPHPLFGFIDGGAEDEVALSDNRAAYDKWKFRQRVFVDVSEIDTEVDLFGTPIRFPLAISPTGLAGLAWPQAEVALARAAAHYGIPFTLATPSTSSLERVAREAGGRLWFQLYVLRDRDYTMKLVERARASEYEALVITGDVAVAGKRERDPRSGFTVPLRPRVENMIELLGHPKWLWQIATHGVPKIENLADWSIANVGTQTLAAMAATQFESALNWETLKQLRDAWPRKLVLKGVLTAADAEQAVALGADGVVVSNHGGRQLDCTVASLDALPEVVRAAGEKLAVLIDGGVRRGSHVIKARALGATAAMIGRATLYGVAAAGEEGAHHALEILTTEIRRSMALLGCTVVRDLDAGVMQRG